MERRLLLFLLYIVCLTSLAEAQSIIVRGIVNDAENNEPIIGALVETLDHSYGAITDTKGQFTLKLPHPGTYALLVHSVSYKDKKWKQALQNGTYLKLSLNAQATSLKTVVITKKSEARKLMESSMPISVITPRQIQGTASNITEVIARTAGVTIRSSGGLGGVVRFNVRGLEGRRIGIYVDGQPLGQFSDYISLNDIPIDMIERIEIYKGIVPYKFGGNSMGGAINIVIKEFPPKYLDASYAIGSFNTHKLNAVYKHSDHDSGLQFGIGGGLNYSDNDYHMKLPMFNNIDVKRDHDRFSQYVVGSSFKATKWWFDELKLEFVGTHMTKQIQGIETDVKKAYNYSYGMVFDLSAKKDNFLIDGLDLDYHIGTFLGYSGLVDTAKRVYDWHGSYLPTSNRMGGELYSFASNGKDKSSDIISKLNLKYNIDRYQGFNFNVYTDINRIKPNNPLMDKSLGFKANYNSHLFSTTVGSSYDLTLFEDKLQSVTTVKWYFFQNQAKVMSTIGINDFDDIHISRNYWGWSQALRYRFIPTLMIKGSYANEIRVPSSDELMGNGYSIIASPGLLPEHIKTFNLGLLYHKGLDRGGILEAELNLFSSKLTNMVHYGRTLLPSLAKYENFGEMSTQGIELDLKGDVLPYLYLYGNATYQDLRDQRMYRENSRVKNPTYHKRIPNVPYLMSNLGFELHQENIGGYQGANTRFLCDISYVHSYFYDFNVSKYQDREIPSFLTTDLALEQSFGYQKWTLTFKVKNIFDKPLLSEFNNPLPGRVFMFKIRYLMK